MPVSPRQDHCDPARPPTRSRQSLTAASADRSPWETSAKTPAQEESPEAVSTATDRPALPERQGRHRPGGSEESHTPGPSEWPQTTGRRHAAESGNKYSRPLGSGTCAKYWHKSPRRAVITATASVQKNSLSQTPPHPAILVNPLLRRVLMKAPGPLASKGVAVILPTPARMWFHWSSRSRRRFFGDSRPPRLKR